MKSLKLAVFVLLILFLSIKISAQESDYAYKSEIGKCQIIFPGNYSESSNFDVSIPYTKVKADFNDDVYYFKFSIHKTDAVLEDNAAFLNSTAESFVVGIKGTILEKKDIKLGKYPGKKLLVSMDNKPLFVHYETFVANHIQYQFFVISKSKDKTKEIKTFLNSFEITE